METYYAIIGGSSRGTGPAIKKETKTMNDMEKIYKELGFLSPSSGRDYIADLVADKENGTDGAISRDYSRDIAFALSDDIARDLHESADHEDWSMDDVRLAFGRVLCAKLGVIQ